MNAAHGSSRSLSRRPPQARPRRARARRLARVVAPVDARAHRSTSSRRAARPSPSQATRSRSSSQTSIRRRAQRARARLAAEKLLDATNRRLVQWTIIGYPNDGWARVGVRRARCRAPVGRGRAPRSGWTSPTPSPRGATTSPAFAGAPRRSTSAHSPPSVSAGQAPTSSSGLRRVTAG